MKKSDQLKQERQSLKDAQITLTEKAESESRDFSPEEATAFDKRHAEIEAMNATVTRAENAEALQLEKAKREATPVTHEVVDGEGKEQDKIMKRYSIHKAIRSQTQRGGDLDGIELEMHQELQKRAQKSGLAVSGVLIPTGERRAAGDGQTVTGDGGSYGGALVPTDQRGVIDMLRPKPILETMGARMITGLVGNVEFPVNEGGIDATWEGEIDEVAYSRNKYSKRTMSPKRLACAVPISLQNLAQSSIDLERYTVEEINKVMSIAVDRAAINGTDPAPIGILNTAGINTIAVGTNGGVPTWADIVAMETAIHTANVDPKTWGYLINAATKGRLKTTKHEAGDLGYLMTMANLINGYAAGVTNILPSALTKGTGTDLSAAIFGDFSELLIGQWGFYDITVDNVSKKRSGQIDIVVNQFLDVLVKQPKAFSVIKDWSL